MSTRRRDTRESLYASATLKGDPACTRDEALRSQWPGAYVLSTNQGSEPCTPPANPFFWCQRQRHVGDGIVPSETSLWPIESRLGDMGYRRGYPPRESDMYGTAPYRALGDGVLRNVDASNALERHGFNQQFCTKLSMEMDWGPLYLDYQDVPNRTESYTRGGNPTRGSPDEMTIIPTLRLAGRPVVPSAPPPTRFRSRR